MSNITVFDPTETARNSILLDICNPLTNLIERSIHIRKFECIDNFIFCVAKRDASWLNRFKKPSTSFIDELALAKLMRTEALEILSRLLKHPLEKMCVDVPTDAAKIVLIAYGKCSVYIVRRHVSYTFDI